MHSKFFGCSAVAAAALLVGMASASAHDGRDNMCGGVMESDADMVVTGDGKALLLGSSEPCPEADVVAVVETETVTLAEPADEAATGLPHDGMVYFALDSAELDAEDQEMLDEIATAVQAQDPASVTVMGHADRSGGEDYNMDLSEQRARTVADALAAAGIPDSAINTMGYGETEPAIETEDGVAMRQNRRTVIEVQ